MNRLHWAHMILSSTFVLALGACTHKPSKPLEVTPSMGYVSQASQQSALLQEARSESETLRAEIGALKILMAKQAGELQSLQGQSQSVHHREQDQGLQLQQIRSELLSSQAERDQLRKRNMELEGQVASMPDTSQLVSDIQALTSSFQQIMSGMKQLTADMMLIKREMRITSGKATPQQTKLSSPKPPMSSQDQQTPDSKGRIVIQNGDTLWKIAMKYDVSVEQLKEWNGITSDLIMTGLHMRVTSPTEPLPAQDMPRVEPSALSTTKEQVKETGLESLPKSLPIQNNRVGNTPEPKHILSLGNPQPNSNESP